MTSNIKVSGIELTPAIKSYALGKVGHIERLVPQARAALVEIELGRTTAHHQKGEIFRAEMNLSSAGMFTRAEATSEDLYAAIDLCKDELARKLTSEKTKQESIFRRGARLAKKLLRMQK